MKRPTMGQTNRPRIIWAVLVFLALIQCGAALPTVNPVQSVELDALDKILGAKNFNGLVAFIASWCPPCRKELPDLAKLYRKYQDKGINIVAISIDADGPASVQPLINELKIPFPVYWVGTKAIKQYELVGIPTLLVMSNGTILEKLPGLHRRKTLERKIKKLIF